jgi:hypothetical protein
MFIEHPKSKFYSLRNKIPVEILAFTTTTKCWFWCDVCFHEFESSPYSTTRSKPSLCPYCKNQKLCQCQECLEKSLASHLKSGYWSVKNTLKPSEVFLTSHKKVIFDCGECFHEFSAIIFNIVRGTWCPYCANQKLCTSDSCTNCHTKSFAAHDSKKWWSVKNNTRPRDTFLRTHKTLHFLCENSHEFIGVGYSISRGSGCPLCKNKSETFMLEYLSHFFPDVVYQKRFEWCKNKIYLPFDFYISSKNVIIELDGDQHFVKVGKWKSPEIQQERDKYKEECATKNSTKIVRVLQRDFYKDINNRKVKLFVELI